MSTMGVRELGAGLWRWTSPHPAWTEGTIGWDCDVASVYWESPGGGAIILVDPIIPELGSADRDRFLRELDRDVERVGGEVAILVLDESHGRSAQDFRARYRAKVHASAATAAAIASHVDVVVEGEATLAGGTRAIVAGGFSPGETVAWLPEAGALVFGDAVLGGSDGATLLLGCDAWPLASAPEQARWRDAVRSALRPLLELDFDMALPSHGQPVLTGGRSALEKILD